MVKKATKELFKDKDASALDRYWGERYVQHNPTLPDGAGVLKGFLPMTRSFDCIRAIAEGELVVTHNRATGWMDRPTIVFDIYRVKEGSLLKNGRLVEHWDVMQSEETKTVSGHSMIDGHIDIEDREKTVENKELVTSFVEEILTKGTGDVTRYISTEGYVQHNPGIGDDLSGLGAALEGLAKAGLSMRYYKTYHIIAEGNFVFTHSEGEFAGKHVAFADLFRVKNGKIVEHWDTMQEVPTTSQNANGMF
ncbi:MAG: SnoaL-like domain protein [Methanomassiliicoccales archaeon PtaU1.Bin124]|nr:MAG: SnoaL-like domain protein [Methanomassiliicoccales archaeon PtaU1.Bin124]